ncbi:MAG: hypothetical protein ACYTXI_38115 [Nostoc sp.]
MSILYTNIGTSDLALEISVNNPELNIHGQKYYLPIDPLYEPNQDKTGLSIEEELVFKNPHQYFQSSNLYGELGFETDVIPTSRELTKRLLEKYQLNSDYWHSRIKTPRIFGVIKKAMSMGVKQGYVFVKLFHI